MAESAGVVVSRFDFFDAAAVDAVFAVCLTPSYCYENFVGLFERWARSFNQNSLAWILSYDVVLEVCRTFAGFLSLLFCLLYID